MTATPDNFDNLGPAGRGVANITRRTRLVAMLCLAAAMLLAWAMLAAMARQAATMSGPAGIAGDRVLLRLPALPLPEPVLTLLQLCLSPVAASQPSAFLALAFMWMLMSVAMMLPSAASMVRTYCELADTAAARSVRAVHPLVLVSGYLAVWLAASLAFAALSVAVQARGGAALDPLPGTAAGAALAFAGLYQFSALKESCLRKCRNPFAVLFARWTDSTAGVFRLGVEQGLWCLGCCWALMLVMFAVGLMNIFWMALIGMFTLWEKQAKGTIPSRAAGSILLVWGATLILVSVLP